MIINTHRRQNSGRRLCYNKPYKGRKMVTIHKSAKKRTIERRKRNNPVKKKIFFTGNLKPKTKKNNFDKTEREEINEPDRNKKTDTDKHTLLLTG